MFSIAVAATVFVVIFLGELPDKTAIAGLVLGSRFPAPWVFAGVAAAFLTHVVIAVTAGSFIALLPHRIVDGVVAALFLIGAVLVWREGAGDEEDVPEKDPNATTDDAGFWKVASVAYMIIFVAEFGDLTQILTADLAAKYHDPVSVGVGAVLALWSVGLLAILGGRALLRLIPIVWITRVAAVVMAGFAAYSIVEVVTG
ncbi:TMEM165/GDT1 family protein [Jatrophihabitans endophyticus]|uniref:TMEM165/GDT1 family protein n=1 Tax=Jatrophihabitans endophyticus TaxID=1206085 RepID=UPI001A042884|nr:TMEM165/GDT1 family protein [Jatrophihabitans endophyticus]MBE7189452.1 TMEM165/GDT1 family protein [Jatrophihabitans endophyticus]